MASQISPRIKQLLNAGGFQVVGTEKYNLGPYGTLEGQDYIKFSVIDPATNNVVAQNVLEPKIINDNVTCFPGQDLRDLGFQSGTFRVRYEFLRRLAGEDENVLVHLTEAKAGEIYQGPFYIDRQGRFFAGNPSTPQNEQLLRESKNYQIHNISPSRTELRIKAKNIKDDDYLEKLSEMGSKYKTITSTLDDPAFLIFSKFQDPASIPGFNAGSGPPPGFVPGSTGIGNPTSESDILEIFDSNFSFTPQMVGAGVRINDAFIISERETPLLSADNVIFNGSGEEVDFSDTGQPATPIDGVFDVDLHSDAIVVKGWTSGIPPTLGNGWDSSLSIGYHAKWVQNEGYFGGNCIKFIDQNNIFSNDSEWPTELGAHRPQIVKSTLNTINSYGVNIAEVSFNVSWWQKTSVLGKGARIGIEYAAGFGGIEARPNTPPDGFFVPGADEAADPAPDTAPDGYLAEPSETQPSTNIQQDGAPEGGYQTGHLSPAKQYVVDEISNGLLIWRPNYSDYNIENSTQTNPTPEGNTGLGIRRVGVEETTGATGGNAGTAWIWKGTIWTLKFPPLREGCTNTSALNYDPAAELDDGSCVGQSTEQPAAGGFDAVLFCRHPHFFENNPLDWKNYPSATSTFFFKYDDGLGDYHIWQSRYGGQESSVRYKFGLGHLFGFASSDKNHIIQGTGVTINGSNDPYAPAILPDGTYSMNPGIISIMKDVGRIKTISEYWRDNSGYKNKKKIIVALISFNDDYRAFLEEENCNELQAQGIIVEFGRYDNDAGNLNLLEARVFHRVGNTGEKVGGTRDVGTVDETFQFVFEDEGNKDHARFWVLGTTAEPARTKAGGNSDGVNLILETFGNDDWFNVWRDQGITKWNGIWGDYTQESYVGIMDDQVFVTELQAAEPTAFNTGFPKPISEVYPGVGLRSQKYVIGAALPSAPNFGELLDGSNPYQDAVTQILALGPNQSVSISNDVVLGDRGGDVTKVLNSGNLPTLTRGGHIQIARALLAPNVNGENSAPPDPSERPDKDGALSPDGQWRWSGADAQWNFAGEEPTPINFNTIYFDEAENVTANTWEQLEAQIPIPIDILVNEPMKLVVEGHYAGGADGGSLQGIVWADEFDLRFVYLNQTTKQAEYASYQSTIVEYVSDSVVKVKDSMEDYAQRVGSIGLVEEGNRPAGTFGQISGGPFFDFVMRFKIADPEELRTYVEVKGNRYLTTNFKRDESTVLDYPNSVIYKLLKPLPSTIGRFDDVKIVKEMMDPYLDIVELVDYVPDELPEVVLKSPNLDKSDSPIRARSTDFKTKTQLLGSNQAIKTEIENKLLSQSLESVEINYDHRQFNDFIHFSSAEKRLENYNYKVTLIESYASSSKSFASVTAKRDESKVFDTKVRQVQNGFDHFERYMFFQSSSFFTSSLGSFYDNAGPKRSGAGTLTNPYVNYSVTSSQYINWYNRQVASGSVYDKENPGYLFNTIPVFVREDINNKSYVDFIKMISQYFDKINGYIKHMADINDRRESISEGLSKELYYAVAKSVGLHVFDGKDLVDLPNYVLGQQVSSSYDAAGRETIGYKEIENTEQDISREIWSRLLANMPLFLQSKGTQKAMKGIINSYGIPSSILRVREYGGPDLDGGTPVNFDIQRKFTKSLDFRSGQRVSFSWAPRINAENISQYPDTVQLRFKAPTSQHQYIWKKGDMGLIMQDNGSPDNIGRLLFYISGSRGPIAVSSSLMPIYDDEFYSTMIRRTVSSASLQSNVDYNLVVKKYDAGIDRFQYVSSTSMTVNGGAGAVSQSYNQSWDTTAPFHIGSDSTFQGAATGSLSFGANAVKRFSGSLMEYRIWTEVLNTGSFDNHTNNPKAYDGNTISSSYESIVSRYSFDDNKDLNSDTSIPDVSAKTTDVSNATANGFPGNLFKDVVDRTKVKVPNLGPSRRASNKLRIENNRPKRMYRPPGTNAVLLPEKRVTTSAYERAAIDSNKVGIYFSPADVINEDIVNSLANIDFNNYLGDPRDRSLGEYRGLQEAQKKYWQKYNSPNNFFDYLKMLKTYDQSIFPTLKKMVPARANAHLGILVEPNILERAKENPIPNPTTVRNYYRSEINISGSTSMSAHYEVQGDSAQGSILVGNGYEIAVHHPQHYESQSLYQLSGSFPYYTGSVDEHRLESYLINQIYRTGDIGNYFDTSVTFGDPLKNMKEVIMPQVTHSRFGEEPGRARIKKFYNSVENAYFMKPSSFSYEPARINLPHDSSTAMRNLYYLGCKTTKGTVLRGDSPVEITLTTPTKIVTKEPGDSKLDII